MSIFFLTLISITVSAQENSVISGGFESTTQIYNANDTLISPGPLNKFGSNNYFKLDYKYNNITAGIQYEAFLPAIKGFPDNFKGNSIANYYFAYKNDMFEVTAGHFYDQFGSGLIFRAWEDRQIGINNAIKGVNVKFTPFENFFVKVIYGKQRLNLKETGEGEIRGLDSELDVLKMFNKESLYSIKIAGSYVQRFQDYTGPEDDFPVNVNASSARFEMIFDKINFKTEYVVKSGDVLENPIDINQDFYTNYFNGRALLVNFGYSQKGIGFSLTARRIENMSFKSDRNYIAESGSELDLNYIPALTKQHDFSLANMYVYAAQGAYKINSSRPIAGEIGGQADLYLNFKRNSFFGGKYGTNIAINYSVWYGLEAVIDKTILNEPIIKTEFLGISDLYYQDFNIEFRKKWSKKFKSDLMYLNTYLNDEFFGTASHEIIRSHIVIGDLTYNFSYKTAIRLELQHLYTKEDKKNWAAGTLELSVAPTWSIFASDMYNYGNIIITERYHYYNFGGSFTKGTTRFSASYGRTRGGLLCIGGVCRYVPSSTGFTFTINTAF